MAPAQRFWIADAHADSLMWNRDLLRAKGRGHLDLERLEQAGVRLQCFTVVTQGYPFVGGFPLFGLARGWPLRALRNPWSRCRFQIQRLHALCQGSQGRLVLAASKEDLDRSFAAGRISAVLGIEGAQVLQGRPERVAELFGQGVRFMGLVHLANNALGGSSSPASGNRPLTALGVQVLEAMAAVRMAVDLAHASRKTVAQILAHPGVRPFCSHTGAAALGSAWRNLEDGTLRAIADRGGVAGIIFTPLYLGGGGISAVVRHVQHALKVMGEDGVALGSDFDGMVPLPRGMRDVRDVPRVIESLCAAGLPERQAQKVAGENLLRFFREALPAGPLVST